MSALTIELPDNLHQKAREVAADENLSMHALIAIALPQKLSRLVPDTYLEERAASATGNGLDEFVAQVPAVEAPESDRLPSDYRPKK